MIDERTALLMLNGELPESSANSDYTRAFYRSLQNFGHRSQAECERGNLGWFENSLRTALELFRQGNQTVKNAIVNVYLFTVSNAIKANKRLQALMEKLFPVELKEEYHRLLYVSGI